MNYGKIKSLFAVILAAATVFTSVPMQSMPVYAAENMGEVVADYEAETGIFSEKNTDEVVETSIPSDESEENIENLTEDATEALTENEAVAETLGATEETDELELASVKGKCGDNATYRIEPIDEYYYKLIISGTGAINDATDVYDCHWRNIGYVIKEVVVEKGITKIGKYAFSGVGSIDAKWTISDTVVEIGEFAFQHAAGKSIKVNAKKVGDDAFNHADFKEIILTNSVEEIGEDAFSNAEMESIEIPASVTKMGRFAFAYCENLKNAKINSRKVSDYAFHTDEALNEVSFGEEVVYIGKNAFEQCTSLEAVKFGTNVLEVDDCAFCNCSNVGTIILNDKLKILGRSVFVGCNYKSIELPESIKEIRQFALGGASNAQVEIKAKSPIFYLAVNGAAYDITKKYYQEVRDGKQMNLFTLVSDESYCYEKNDMEAKGKCGENVLYEVKVKEKDRILTISGTGRMYDYKTYNDVPWAQLTSITKVEIQDGVTHIGDWSLSFLSAYYYSKTPISEVTIPDSVVSIGEHAFDSAKFKSLNLVLPANLREIGDYAFYTAQGLNSVTIPENVKYIGNRAFYGCSSLKNATYGQLKNEVEIGEYAFYNCGLVTIDIPDKVTKLGISAYGSNASATGIYIGKGINSIPDGAFGGCRNLEEVLIPDNVMSIGESVFNGCTKLKKITIPGRMGYIPASTFKYCSSLTSVTIGEGIKKIDRFAFQNCTGLTNVVIPGSVEEIACEAFSGCASLESVTFGNGLKIISVGAFENCSKLTDINFESAISLGEIGSRAFKNTGNTENKLVIPDSVYKIESEAFTKANFTGLEASGAWYTLDGKTYDIKADFNHATDSYEYYSFPVKTVFREVGDFDVYKGKYEPPKPVAATGVSLNSSNVLIRVGDAVTLNATVTPANTTDKVVWSSADESVVTVSDSGVITGTGAGQTRVTATAGNKSASALVTVKQVVTGISWKSVPSCLYVGESAIAEFVLEPAGAAYKSIGWGASYFLKMESAEQENSFIITPSKKGTYKISVTVDGTYKLEQEIEVKDYEIILNYQYEEGGVAKTEKMISGLGNNLSNLDSIKPSRDGFIFLGWYTEPAADGDTSTPLGIEVTSASVGNKELTNIYAYWKELNDGEIYVKPVGDYVYTGKPIKPAVVVYDGSDNSLTEKVDYTVAYKNNTKTGTAEIVVTGKGNYAGKKSINFNIVPADIGGDDFSAADFILAYKEGKVQKSVPVLKWNGKTVPKAGYTVTYVGLGEGGAFTDAGEYEIKLTGQGDFTGTRTVKEIITSKTFISKATVEKIPNMAYDGKIKMPSPAIKMGKVALIRGCDYDLYWYNNVNAGKATLRIVGRGNYIGTKEVNFTITGVSLAKAQLEGTKIADQVYTGQEIKPAFTLTYTATKGETPETLKEGVDYEITGYKNNIKPGTATISLRGMGKYAGTTKNITFKIKAYAIADAEVTLDSDEVVYSKAGAKPVVLAAYNGMTLKEGVDYKLSYKNNTKVGDASVTITGKGMYAGSKTFEYKVIPAPVKDLKVVADDFIYKSGKSGYDKPKFKVYSDGKLLAAKEYSYSVTYANATTLEDGTEKESGLAVEKTDKLKAGTVLNLHIDAIGDNYDNSNGEGTGIDITFKVVKESIARATVTITDQVYSGKNIKPDSDAFLVQIKTGGETHDLTYGVDYEIDETSYKNNVKKGIASVDIVGKGNYGLRKTITFKVNSKSF
ncbi:MAG: leucine-rich repeat protein [Lachnospiraceae bacterium]|nr:leucine-rich repeat protein [Candidatus Colinaster scatohippi]